jgi:hypothetical protein
VLQEGLSEPFLRLLHHVPLAVRRSVPNPRRVLCIFQSGPCRQPGREVNSTVDTPSRATNRNRNNQSPVYTSNVILVVSF